MKQTLLGIVLVPMMAALSGCAPQSGAEQPVRADRWEVTPADRDGLTVAAISAPDGNNRIQVYCHAPDKVMAVMLFPRDLPGDAKDQRFTFAYDGGAPVEQHWRAQMYQDRFYDFSLGSEEPAFAAAIDDLENHQSVVAAIITAGKEARRDTFTLSGAAEAIDQVAAACR